MVLTPHLATDSERYNRRLSDKIQLAFDHACDSGELDIAADLLMALEAALLRVPPRPERREALLTPLLDAHNRLWHLREASQQVGEPIPAK